MSAAVLDRGTKETTKELADSGDHDKFSHYVKKSDQLKSAIEGIPAVALCGKVWHPTSDPTNYEVCPTCKDIFENVVGTGSGAS